MQFFRLRDTYICTQHCWWESGYCSDLSLTGSSFLARRAADDEIHIGILEIRFIFIGLKYFCRCRFLCLSLTRCIYVACVRVVPACGPFVQLTRADCLSLSIIAFGLVPGCNSVKMCAKRVAYVRTGFRCPEFRKSDRADRSWQDQMNYTELVVTDYNPEITYRISPSP